MYRPKKGSASWSPKPFGKEHPSSVEKQLIEQAMLATDGVAAKAARLLNMRRTTLVEKLGKYQLN